MDNSVVLEPLVNPSLHMYRLSSLVEGDINGAPLRGDFKIISKLNSERHYDQQH